MKKVDFVSFAFEFYNFFRFSLIGIQRNLAQKYRHLTCLAEILWV